MSDDSSGIDVLIARHKRLHLALWANFSIVAVSFIFEVAELSGLFTFNADPFAELTVLEITYGFVGAAMVAISVVTIILWCMWLHRAAKNVVQAGPSEFDYTPAWAVGWHFIPFANLWVPFEVMRKIWNASAGETADLYHTAPIVNRWWVAWIIAGISGNLSARIMMQAETAEGLYYGTALGAISSIATFVAIPTALLMLQKITQGQSARFGQQAG